MSKAPLTEPDHSYTGWPGGIKYIVGNEAAERFSYYGMKAILYVYLTMLIQQTGVAEKLAAAEASTNQHLFIAGVYAFPVLGAILADKLLGKYHVILSLSLLYCVGHGLLAVFEGNLTGIYAGLACIAVGAGGIKPCVSAHVGDQFGRGNWHLLNKVFQIFYFSINFGSFFATLLIPWLYNEYGPHLAFGLPGLLMAIATFVFWLGRHSFVHVPASPGGRLGLLDTLVGFSFFVPLFMLLFAKKIGLDSMALRLGASAAGIFAGAAIFSYRQKIQEDDGFLAVLIVCVKGLFSKGGASADADGGELKDHWFFGAAARKYGQEAAEGPRAVFRIISVFIFVSAFWMLFSQHSTTWIEQAKQMDLKVGPWELYPSQIASANPVMVMALIPLFMFIIFPWVEKRGIRVTPLRKMSVGMILASLSFVTVAIIQARIESKGVGQVSVAWQMIPYIVITMAEVLVSITGLEFAYSQAPKRMKSILMSFWLLCNSFGNWFTSLLADTWKEWPLSKAFWAFSALMMLAALAFSLRSAFYTYREYK